MGSHSSVDDGSVDYIAVYMPIGGIIPAMIPISARSREDLLSQAEKSCPPGKRLSRIVRATSTSQNIWENDQGWLPTLEEQQRNGWR